jgi:hypothetical protein
MTEPPPMSQESAQRVQEVMKEVIQTNDAMPGKYVIFVTADVVPDDPQAIVEWEWYWRPINRHAGGG